MSKMTMALEYLGLRDSHDPNVPTIRPIDFRGRANKLFWAIMLAAFLVVTLLASGVLTGRQSRDRNSTAAPS